MEALYVEAMAVLRDDGTTDDGCTEMVDRVNALIATTKDDMQTAEQLVSATGKKKTSKKKDSGAAGSNDPHEPDA